MVEDAWRLGVDHDEALLVRQARVRGAAVEGAGGALAVVHRDHDGRVRGQAVRHVDEHLDVGRVGAKVGHALQGRGAGQAAEGQEGGELHDVVRAGEGFGEGEVKARLAQIGGSDPGATCSYPPSTEYCACHFRLGSCFPIVNTQIGRQIVGLGNPIGGNPFGHIEPHVRVLLLFRIKKQSSRQWLTTSGYYFLYFAIISRV